MKSITLILLGLLCFIAFPKGVDAKTQDAVWPTKEFEIRWYSPRLEDQLFELRPWLAKALMSEEEKAGMLEWDTYIKTSLREIAEYYDSAGLGSPNLPIEKGRDGVKRYIVYVYDFKDGFITDEAEEFALGYYRGFCSPASVLFPKSIDLDPSEDKLALNLHDLRKVSPFSLPKKEKQKFYGTMAHEVFHAIQYSYDAQFSSILVCKRTGGHAAVVEGTATAAAAVATDNKFPGFLKTLDWNALTLGAFPYGGDEEFLEVDSPISATGADAALEYKTSSFWRYLIERFAEDEPKFGLSKVFNTLFRKELVYSGIINPTLKERYQWLNEGVKEISGSPLYIVFPDFTAELGSYFPSRYKGSIPNISRFKWYDKIFPTPYNQCHSVRVDGAGKKFGKTEIIGSIKIKRNSATCIDLEWFNLSANARIEVEATYHNENAIDQLHLGISHFLTNGKTDNCYKVIMDRVSANPSERPNLECSFGKLFIKNDPNGTFTKTAILGTDGKQSSKGEFFDRKLGDYGNAAFTLTNMAPDQAGTDIPITDSAEDKLVVKFSIVESKVKNDGAYLPPIMILLMDPAGILGAIPNPDNQRSTVTDRVDFRSVAYSPLLGLSAGYQGPVIDRYSFYGIKKKADALPGGLGASFQVVSVDDPSKKYSILPIGGEFKFAYTGKVNAIVTNEDSATSVLCATTGQMPPPAMEVTQSDEDQLRFNIKTDLCKMKPNRKIEVVDSIDGTFVYAFGRRAYPATAPQDIVTPGIELYIDEYLKELVRQGLPIPPTVLMSDGSVPGDEDGDGTPDNTPTVDPDSNPDTTTTDIGVCKCTCEEFRRIKDAAKTIRRDPSQVRKMKSLLACAQVCAKEYAKCDDN